jgi:hypothetical protein
MAYLVAPYADFAKVFFASRISKAFISYLLMHFHLFPKNSRPFIYSLRTVGLSNSNFQEIRKRSTQLIAYSCCRLSP